MDKSVLIIEIPELSDEGAAEVHNLLQALMNAFESHYHHHLKRYHSFKFIDDELQDIM
jgi:hypothetical protein